MNSSGNSHRLSQRAFISVSSLFFNQVALKACVLHVLSCLVFTQSLFINLHTEGRGRALAGLGLAVATNTVDKRRLMVYGFCTRQSAINLKGSLFSHVWNVRWAGFQASGEHRSVNEDREACSIHFQIHGFRLVLPFGLLLSGNHHIKAIK